METAMTVMAGIGMAAVWAFVGAVVFRWPFFLWSDRMNSIRRDLPMERWLGWRWILADNGQAVACFVFVLGWPVLLLVWVWECAAFLIWGMSRTGSEWWKQRT